MSADIVKRRQRRGSGLVSLARGAGSRRAARSERRWSRLPLVPLISLALAATGVTGAYAYANRAGTDIVMDAPWRSVRDYVPVMFFFPQFESGCRVERIRIVECTEGLAAERVIVVDAANGPDTLNGATFVDPLGRLRGGLEPDERITNFWHYIVRVPREALSIRESPATVMLRAEVEWTRHGLLGRRAYRNHRVLRVVMDAARLPRFDPRDLYLDTHMHSIAEQTTSGTLDVNGGAKAYAAPLVMLLESAYALGLVETQPSDGNWTAFKDRVAVTDHNIFYSRKPYDTGTAPPFGPTASTDGEGGEAAWYREHLGRLAGEEITLRRGSNQDRSATLNLGHHLLAYGAPHFEGPWHGGLFLTSTLENPNTLEAVLSRMKTSPGSFAYAAHPELAGFVWPPEYFAQAAGFPPYDSGTGAAVDSSGGGFVFRGLEVWNARIDQVARDNGRLPASSAFAGMDPFPGGPEAQRFRPVAWDGELTASIDTLLGLVGRGLRFAFRETPGDRFVRKLYLSAGSDAHGDFNYSDEVAATAVPWSGSLHSSAFARARTYVLAHDRPDAAADPVEAFRDGNAVITDGPLLAWELDGDGRHDPGAGAARWHDADSRWENAEGRIGGAGRFDGGRTLLVVAPGANAWIRSEWRRSVSPGAGDITRIHFDRVMASARDSFAIAAGSEGMAEAGPLPVALDSLCALVATARDLRADERCITNPVWVAPVRIGIDAERASPDTSGIAYRSGALRITFDFPFSMSADPRTRAFLRPLDGRGVSTDPEIELVPGAGWEDQDGITRARYTVTNAADIPFPVAAWDASSHLAARGVRSFVVYLVSPADVHGNRLNDIARAFACPAPEPGAGERGKP